MDALRFKRPESALYSLFRRVLNHLDDEGNPLRWAQRGIRGESVAKVLGDASEGCIATVKNVRLAVRASGKAGLGTGAQRFLDDGLDGPRTAAAFGTATETSVDLLGIAGKAFRAAYRAADIVVGQDVAGTNDHEKGGPVWLFDSGSVIFDIEEPQRMQKEKPRFEAIPNWPSGSLERL
jgi:hypothetical protein